MGILTRLEAIEAELKHLSFHMAARSSFHTALLVGWPAISRYAGKAPKTLRRYKRLAAFPVVRWGRHVVCSPEMVAAWLLAYDKERRRRAMNVGIGRA